MCRTLRNPNRFGHFDHGQPWFAILGQGVQHSYCTIKNLNPIWGSPIQLRLLAYHLLIPHCGTRYHNSGRIMHPQHATCQVHFSQEFFHRSFPEFWSACRQPICIHLDPAYSGLAGTRRRPCTCSGDMYWKVPITIPGYETSASPAGVPFGPGGSIFARPKSSTFTPELNSSTTCFAHSKYSRCR